MTITNVEGSQQEILKQYGEALTHEKAENSNTNEVLTEIVGRKITTFPKGTWLSNDYIKWAKDILNVGHHSARKLMKDSGHYSSKSDGKYKIY